MSTGVEYAAKFIRKRRRALDTQREIAHEVAVLLQCAACPRVVRLHEVYDERSEMVLVLELYVYENIYYISILQCQLQFFCLYQFLVLFIVPFRSFKAI